MVLRLFGRHADRSYARAMRLYNEGAWADAVAAFDTALDRLHDQTDPYTALARFYRAGARARLGETELLAGRYREALTLLDAALAEQPGFPDLHFHKAAAHLRLDELEPARLAALTALRLNPGFLRARILSSLVYQQLGDPGAADSELQHALRLAHEQTQALAAALGGGATPPSFERLWSLLFDPTQGAAPAQEAEALYAAGRFQASRAAFAALVERYPDYADLRLKLALVLFALRDFDAARAELEVAVDVNPRFADAWALLGAVHLLRGEIAWGRVAFCRAKREGLPSPFTDYGLAVCALLLGDSAECVALLRPQATQTDAPFSARHLLACARAQNGDGSGALDLLGRLVEHAAPSAERSDAAVDGALLALERGDKDRARKLLAVLPAEANGLELALARARGLAADGRASDALELVEALLLKHPQPARAHATAEPPALALECARLEAAVGRTTVALARVETMARRWPGLPGGVELQIALLRATGRSREALEAWENQRGGGAWSFDPALALQALFAAREAGDGARAFEIEERLALVAPLWFPGRAQRPQRWLQPLLPPAPPSADADKPAAWEAPAAAPVPG